MGHRAPHRGRVTGQSVREAALTLFARGIGGALPITPSGLWELMHQEQTG
jgi:hypothetical protein